MEYVTDVSWEHVVLGTVEGIVRIITGDGLGDAFGSRLRKALQ
jgi:hypothetical protein